MISTHIKVMLLDIGRNSSSWTENVIRKSHPDAEVSLLPFGRVQTIRRQWRALRGAKLQGYHYSVLPLRKNYLFFPGYWVQVIIFLMVTSGMRGFITANNDFVAPKKVLIKFIMKIFGGYASLLLQPFITIINLFCVPIYLIRQITQKFILTPEKTGDEFVGFGKGKSVGGLVYWLTWVKKAKRFGLFGLDSDSYMGMPISVHTWPLATALLGALGFRRYIYLSVLLMGMGLVGLSLYSGNPWMIILVPLVICSTYFVFNIYVSTCEILAWAFGFLAFAALYMHLYIVAGIFLASVILIHPGAGFLIFITCISFGLLAHYPLFELLALGALTIFFSIWWAIPYLRSRDKLGRTYMINKIWGYTYKWTRGSFYQFLVYTVFFLVSIFLSIPIIQVLMLALPLFALYYNIKVNWTFSRYTLGNYMLFVGAIYLSAYPSIYQLIAYLFVIYTSGEILLPGTGSRWGFDLTPVTLGETRNTVKKIFSSIRKGRVAFEIGNQRSHIGWSVIGVLGYILADENLDILDPGYTEVGDYQIFHNYCQYFNSEATQGKFEEACQECGVNYIVAFTEEFRKQLEKRGYKIIGELTNVELRNVPDRPPIQIALFELPWQSHKIEPKTELRVSPGELRFYALAGQPYVLRYSSFRGWRAFQRRGPISIKDSRPGMSITADDDGEVVIKYKYLNYWLLNS